jgi:PGF-pre-PGF domain-containing protein
MTQDKDAANGENMSLSDTNRSSSISVNVSLESENNSKPSVQLENVSSGEKVSLNIQERPRDESQTSKPSQDLETAEDESVELEAVSFQVEKKSEDSAINVTTVENPSKLNITSENNIYKATEVSTDVETDNAELIYNVQKSFLSQNNATKNDLVVNRWKNSSRIQTLPTEVLNESASNLTVKAASPNGFSIFTVGLKNTTSNASVTSREFNFEYTFPNIQLVKLFKAILIFSSLYLIRYPLLKTLFTLDIRLSYIIEGVHVRVLELRRRLRWWLDAEEGREEFSLASDVNSLRNKKEALQFKKKRLEKEVKRKKELRNRYLMRLELLTNKVEKWREKLDD